MVHQRIWGLVLLLTLLVVLLEVPALADSFLTSRELMFAYARARDQGLEERARNLLRSNEEAARKLCGELLRLHVEIELDGHRDPSTPLRLAKQLADDFVRVFSDPAPLREVARYERWSMAEKRKKREADHLAQDATSIRGDTVEAAHEKWRRAVALYEEIGAEADLARVLTDLGLSYFGAGELERSLEVHGRAWALRHELLDVDVVRKLAANLGFTHDALGHVEEAIEHLELCLPLLEGEEQRSIRALALGRLGLLYAAGDDIDAAAAALGESATIYRELDEQASEGETLSNLGRIYLQAGEHERALTVFRRAVAVHEQREDWPRLAADITSLALIYENRRDSGKALDAHRRSLELYRQLDDTRGQARALIGMGRIQQSLKLLEQSISTLQEALELAKSHDDLESRLQALEILGFTFGMLGQFDKAQAFLQQAVELQEESDGVLPLLRALSQIAAKQGDYDTALTAVRRALALVRSLGDPDSELELRVELAGIYALRGDSSAVRKELGAARRSLASSGSKTAQSLRDIAELYGKLPQPSDRRQAEELLREALVLAEDAADRSQQESVRIALGELLAGEDPGAALEHYRRARKLHTPTSRRRFEEEAFLDLADRHLDRGELPAAVEMLHEGLTIGNNLMDRGEEASKLLHIGFGYMQLGEVRESLPYLERAWDLQQDIEDRTGLWYTGSLLGGAYSGLGRLPEALRVYSLVVESIEAVRRDISDDVERLNFFADMTLIYRNVVFVLMQLEDQKPGSMGAQAFAYAERGKARELLDLLAESGAVETVGVDPRLRRRRHDLNDQIVARETSLRRQLVLPEEERQGILVERLRREIADLELREEQVLDEIRERFPRYAELIRPRPIPVAGFQRDVLRQGEALVEYHVIDQESIVFLVSRGILTVRRIPIERQELESKVRSFHATLADPFRGNLEPAHDLYRLLFADLEADLEGIERLYIVPDGALFYLPFEALSRSATRPELLLDSPYTLSYAPSASVLAQIRRERAERPDPDAGPARRPLLVFADPQSSVDGRPPWPPSASVGKPAAAKTSRGGERIARPVPVPDVPADCAIEDFPLLQYARQEAETIAGLFELELDDEAFNVGAGASEAKLFELDLSRYKILHFAVHGIVCDETQGSWLQPSLILSANGGATPGRDGILQMSEIFNLRLDADLVTLSACSTGLGRRVEGEGLIGLTRAFLYAGTPSVVVSLWSVDDRSTALLMERFYGELRRGTGKAEALRRAKRWLRAEHAARGYDDPFHWAPFVLIGENL